MIRYQSLSYKHIMYEMKQSFQWMKDKTKYKYKGIMLTNANSWIQLATHTCEVMSIFSFPEIQLQPRASSL